MATVDDSPWRFEAPIDRRALRIRAAVAWGGALLLCVAAAGATHRGSVAGTIVGLVAAAVFGVLGYSSWCIAAVNGAPLVLDENGIAFDDGLGPRAFLRWEEVDEVELRGAGPARQVVVLLRGSEAGELILPRICYAGAPPEWTAGLIETFRHRALHRD